jgi:hypothetical protein
MVLEVHSHDGMTCSLQGPFTYEALPPTDITFRPLKQDKEFNAADLLQVGCLPKTQDCMLTVDVASAQTHRCRALFQDHHMHAASVLDHPEVASAESGVTSLPHVWCSTTRSATRSCGGMCPSYSTPSYTLWCWTRSAQSCRCPPSSTEHTRLCAASPIHPPFSTAIRLSQMHETTPENPGHGLKGPGVIAVGMVLYTVEGTAAVLVRDAER